MDSSLLVTLTLSLHRVKERSFGPNCSGYYKKAVTSMKVFLSNVNGIPKQELYYVKLAILIMSVRTEGAKSLGQYQLLVRGLRS